MFVGETWKEETKMIFRRSKDACACVFGACTWSGDLTVRILMPSKFHQVTGDAESYQLDLTLLNLQGERFLYVKPERKLKNEVPEDPGTFVGLKVKQKGKRGPSPKFK